MKTYTQSLLQLPFRLTPPIIKHTRILLCCLSFQTSYDGETEVFAKYRESRGLVKELKRLGANVYHGVDASAIESYRSTGGLSDTLKLASFDQIIFNHPHTVS